MTDTVATPPAETGKRMIRRHPLVVRITHWVNVVCVIFLLMSGLQIFNAHPHLYWGETSTFNANNQSVDTVLSIGAIRGADGEPQGVVRLFGGDFIDTDGFLGASTYQGEKVVRAFPAWLTLPSWRDLAAGRLWHFFFAWVFVINGLVYVVYGLAGRHFWRDLIPSRDQWRGFFRTIWDHIRLRFPKGEEAARYNIIQKLAYLTIIVALIVMVMTGLSMSPGMNAGYPWLADIFGGRQGARTWHFISAAAIVLFVLVHVIMVLVSGVWNNIRSMITGRYAIKQEVAE